MKRLIMGGLLAATTLLGGLALTFSTVSAVQGDNCVPYGDGYVGGTEKIDTSGDPATVPYMAPDGYLVDAYCVKASTVRVIVPVSPPSKTVDIDHPTVNSVSHYSVSWTPVCEFDPAIAASNDDCEPPCEYDESNEANSDGCEPPCEYDESIAANSDGCVPPCEYDESIDANSDDCVPPCEEGDLTVYDCEPPAKVMYTEWVDGEFKCGDTTVEQTRTKITTQYVWDSNKDEEDWEDERLVYEEESYGEWVLDIDNPVETKETRSRKLNDNEIKACPTTPPVVVQVASQPPVAPAAAPPVAPAAAPPVAPAAPPAAVAPAAAVSATPTQLPSTGSSSWVTALIALVTLAGGTGLVRLSRRPTD